MNNPTSLMYSDLSTYGAKCFGTNNNCSTVCLNLTDDVREDVSEWKVSCFVGDTPSNNVSLEYLFGEMYLLNAFGGECVIECVMFQVQKNLKSCMCDSNYVFVCSV